MRDWLKNILIQLYEPNPEHPGHLNEKQRNKVSYLWVSFLSTYLQGLRKKDVGVGWEIISLYQQKPSTCGLTG